MPLKKDYLNSVFFLLMCMVDVCVLPACMSLYHIPAVPVEPEEGDRFP